MDKVHKYKLDVNRTYLEDNLEPKDIIGHLFSKGAIDSDDEDIILNTQPQTRKTRVIQLFKIIRTRGPEAYKKLLDSLEEQYKFIAEKLESTPLSNIQEANTANFDADSFAEYYKVLPVALKDAAVTSKTLIKLSRAVGVNWEMIALELDVAQIQIEQSKLNYAMQGVTMQFFDCLEKWRGSQTMPTVSKCIEAFIDLSGPVTIDWKFVRKALDELKS